MSDQQYPAPDKEEVERRKREIKDTLCCPHCGERMRKWAVPQTLFTTWANPYMYICFNDECPYMLKSYEAMARMGNEGTYRLMYDPELDCCQPVPVLNKKALRDGIIEDEDEQEEEIEVTLQDILGMWKLVSCRFVDSKGQESLPLGTDLQGMLNYLENGTMSVQNIPADGALLQTPEGTAVALETYGAYNGRFELHAGNAITHYVDNSMFPDWNGRSQEREIQIKRDRLILISPLILVGGQEQQAHMIWKRAD